MSDEPPPSRPARPRPVRTSAMGRGGKGAPFRSRGKAAGPHGRGPAVPGDRIILYGWHPVVEALRNARRTPLRLLATENGVRRLQETLAVLPLAPEIVSGNEISRLLEPDAVHQGLYLETEPLEPAELDGLPADALVLALDQITDPHNVGAIVRTAAAFGASAILTTARHSPGATGVLAKAASGGLEHVPFLVVRNLADALIELGRQGFRRIGLDSGGTTPLLALAVQRPVVLVLGAEGRGLRQRTRDNCDVLARLDLPGRIDSLNVSNAAAVALYAVTAAPVQVAGEGVAPAPAKPGPT